MKKFLSDFKSFAIKGNVVDMAVGIIIGSAFSTLVKSLVENILNPLIGLLFQINLDKIGWNVGLGEKQVFFAVGSFISAIINFLLLSFILFCIVRAKTKINDLATRGKKTEETPPQPKPSTNEILADILVELKKQNKDEKQ
ncbi:MAG: large conductance mechanosensitive channel protein MscL [Sphaerochaetaceae bacterium]|nr:large conductance mechanosensitive channel protein MscL [Spirochaetales bacterium]MDY5968166.1 large conductance mechanosensitive channel protein MscL [Sphaerochaetaceae bacterium]